MSDFLDKYKRMLEACQAECGLEISKFSNLCYKCPMNNEMFVARLVFEEREMPRLCPVRNDSDKLQAYCLARAAAKPARTSGGLEPSLPF